MTSPSPRRAGVEAEVTFGHHSTGSLRRQAGLALLLIGSLAPPARAESTAAVELNWTAPDDCPDQAQVQAQISRLAPSPAARERPLRVEGSVRRGAGGFILELLLRDGEFVGRRRFESDSCSEVVGAAAVTIALLLSSGGSDASGASGAGAVSDAGAASNATVQAQPQAPTGATTPSAGAAASAKDTPATTAAAAERRSAPPDSEGERGWRLVLGAPSVSAGFGLLPEPSFGLGLAVAFEDDRWRLFVGGTWNFEVSVHPSNSSDRGAEISRGTGRMGGCRWLGAGRFQWAPCAVVALHYLTARGVGSDVSAEEARTPWVALGPSLLGRLRLSDAVRLAASGGLEVQTARPKFVIDGLGEIEQIGALELTSLLGAEWIF